MGSSSYLFQISMRMRSSGSTKLIKCMPSVGGGTTCAVWAGSRLMVTLGWPKWSKPWSIKSWMACLKALKWSVLCLDPWWYAQWRSILNCDDYIDEEPQKIVIKEEIMKKQMHPLFLQALYGKIIQSKSQVRDANFIWDPGKLNQDPIFWWT